MRVVYLHQYFVTPEMTGGTRSYEMAKRLVADGHEVHMITSDSTGTKPRTEVVEGIKVTWLPVRYSQNMNAFRRIWAFLLFAFLASFVGIRKKPSVVFASSTPLTIAIPGLVIKFLRRVPMVFEVRDPWPEMLVGMAVLTNPILVWAAERLKKLAYSNSQHIVALSDGMKETVINSGYDPDKITVIPNASDVNRFKADEIYGNPFRKQYEWLGDRKMVLYAGTLGFANSVGYLVEVAAEVKSIDPEIRFVVAGEGAEKESIGIKAQRAGVLNENFFMLPSVPKRDVPGLFAATSVSTVLLRDVPELWTNSSNKFFDALASGRPVVVNNVGWQQRLLEESNAGLHIDPTDISKAAASLVGVLRDDAWLSEAGKNAREIAQSLFDIELLYAKLKHVLLKASN